MIAVITIITPTAIRATGGGAEAGLALAGIFPCRVVALYF
jgi:hypothetical protein